MLKSKTIQILIVSLVLVLAVDIAVDATTPGNAVSFTDRLEVQPVNHGVYLLGNSMFKTGVELEAMQAGIPERDVRFNYYDGHYTSLWYLIAEGALGPSKSQPDLIVWGFRPAFALLPAFRQNRPNSTDLFEFGDLAYERLTSETLAEPLVDAQLLLDNWSGVFSERETIHDMLIRATGRAGLAALDAAGKNVIGLRDRLIDGDRGIAIEIVSAATGGDVQLTEEQVVDGVGDFISGPPTAFSDGFIPLTAQSFLNDKIYQLVVIWKPIKVANGEPDPAEDRFVEDAIAFFRANGILYVDLYRNATIIPEMYAKGDHYNSDGRSAVTAILTERVRALSENE